MPETYDGVSVPGGEESVTISRECLEPAGCGDHIEITLSEGGEYEGGMFFGEVELPADGATVVTERLVHDEWLGQKSEVEWSDTNVVEFWMHEECAKPDDYDPGEGAYTVSE